MCITAWPARLSETITGTWEVLADGNIQHVIWYQNKVRGGTATDDAGPREDGLFQGMVEMALSQDVRWDILAAGFSSIDTNVAKAEVEWRKRGQAARRYAEAKSAVLGVPTAASKRPQGNCLIIPLMGTWESIRLLNTADTPDLLSDVRNAVQFPMMRGMPAAAAFEVQSLSTPTGRMVFLKFDVYDIVIAENAASIPSVLPQIVEEKRPEVNDEVFSTFGDWYRCPVAVCCFKAGEQAEAKPIAFAFEPTDPDHLVVYTLDAHDGNAPDPNAEVHVDHTIFVGSYLTPPNHAGRIHFTNQIPDHLRPYVLDYVMGMPDLKTKMINGDFVFDVLRVRQGVFRGTRQLPPYAPAREAPVPIIARSEAYANGHVPAMLFDR